MVYGEQLDPFAEFKRAHEDYRVYDAHYENIGKADELFVDAADRPLYIGIRTGLLEARAVLVPIEIIRINDKRRVIEVSDTAEQVRHAPSLEDREEIPPELEASVHSYFGLANPLVPEEEYVEMAPEPGIEDRFAPDTRIDVEPGERQEAQERSDGPLPPSVDREDLTHQDPGREGPVTSPRGPGKGWARGTEKIPPEGGSRNVARDPLTSRARRLRR